MRSPEEYYEEAIAALDDADPVPEDLAQVFHANVRRIFLELAYAPYNRKNTGFRRRIAQRWANDVTQKSVFPVELTGTEHLEHADLILGNHQGPHDGEGEGGMESLLIYSMLGPKTRVVLKGDLINYRGWNPVEITKALAFRRANPIPFDRPDNAPGPRREKGEEWSAEFARVSRQIADAIREECSVLLYPEGMRSSDGELLPFTSRLFTDTAEQYLLPNIDTPEHIQIGLAVADTLQTFPHGYGKNVPMYKNPFRIHGIPYNTDALVEHMHIHQNARSVTRFFARDAHRQMKHALSCLLETGSAIQYASESPDQQSLSGDRT